jgi:hypothetical protein
MNFNRGNSLFSRGKRYVRRARASERLRTTVGGANGIPADVYDSGYARRCVEHCESVPRAAALGKLNSVVTVVAAILTPADEAKGRSEFGLASVRRHQFAEAKKHFKAAVTLRPTDYVALN